MDLIISDNDILVSIHATLAGGDRALHTAHGHGRKFLSTPPSRVATKTHFWQCYLGDCFYPRHPRGWRLTSFQPDCTTVTSFYPRHPRGWRPLLHCGVGRLSYVSIHATLAGGDGEYHVATNLSSRFLSTPPSRVATYGGLATTPTRTAFLSTPPSRVATRV